jgi:hypothetical protein
MMPGGAPSDSCVTFYPIAQLQELLGSHGNVLATKKAPIRISVGAMRECAIAMPFGAAFAEEAS